jgi:hypothetical protein
MKLAFAVLSVVLFAGSVRAADPLYLDQLIESPQASLEARFGAMKKESCFQLAPDRYLLISMGKKEAKPWRVVLSSVEPCKKPVPAPNLEIRERNGIDLGDNTVTIVQRLGRPDAAAKPDPALKKLGETEYFYICRVSEGCARHTSILISGGTVSAIAEWYSE